MNTDETGRLVNAIVSTWPAGVKGHIWADVLATLDRDHARDAYTELRDHDERPPSVARFLATYHAKRTHNTGDPDQPTKCEICDGTGWVESPPERAHRAEHCRPTEARPCICHAVEPCRCSRGRRGITVHRAIVEHNAKERRP